MRSSSPASILIVEDERLVAKDIQQTLAGFGYDAFGIASSAEEAVREMEAVRAMLHDGAQPRVSIAERDSLVFRKIRDVRR